MTTLIAGFHTNPTLRSAFQLPYPILNTKVLQICAWVLVHVPVEHNSFQGWFQRERAGQVKIVRIEEYILLG